MTISEGDVIHAYVERVAENGIYLRSEDKSGFVNVTNITWGQGRVEPEKYAKVGAWIQVLVYAVTPNSFYASIKGLNPEANPWRNPEQYEVGSIHQGRVHQVTPFGVFVELPSGVFGLINGPENADVLNVGDEVEVRVVALDAELKKIELEQVVRTGLPGSTTG